jgi:tetratricopeptide (TPR) repeat protein
MYAVREALDAREEWAAEFVDCVNKFLYHFGLDRDRRALSQVAAKVGRELGSQTWLPTKINSAEELYRAGQYQQAAQVFNEIVAGLGEQPSYERCVALGRLGRCWMRQGQAAQAVKVYRRGLAVAKQLEASESVKRQIGVLQSELADVLSDMGNYGEARIAYEAALTIAQEQNDVRQIAVVEGQISTLALLQGNIPEVERRYHEAVTNFQQLNEPAMEAVAWHQLGRVYEALRQWDAAERAYRESARIQEALGNLAGAAHTWNQLATFNQFAGKIDS